MSAATAGRVDALHVAAASGAPMRALASAELRADFGLVDDRKARAGSRRQVTIVWAEQLAEVAAEMGVEIAPGATRRNVTVSGLGSGREPGAGARLRLGSALLELTVEAVPCGLMDEVIADGACRALRGRSGWAGRVLRGGTVREGDAVEWVT